MKKTSLLLYLTIFNLIVCNAQKRNNYFFNSFIVGSSLTYRGFETLLPEVREYTWNFNVSTSLGKYFYSGLQVMNIFIDYKTDKSRRYNIFGWFTEYNIAPNSKFRPFLEISVNKGDYYYPSSSYFPESNKSYYYFGAGGGADMPLTYISKNLFIDLSFIFYLQRLENKKIISEYNQYIIGLNYRFGKLIEKPFKK